MWWTYDRLIVEIQCVNRYYMIQCLQDLSPVIVVFLNKLKAKIFSLFTELNYDYLFHFFVVFWFLIHEKHSYQYVSCSNWLYVLNLLWYLEWLYMLEWYIYIFTLKRKIYIYIYIFFFFFKVNLNPEKILEELPNSCKETFSMGWKN